MSWELLLLDPSSLFGTVGEGQVSVSKRFTLQPQVQGLQFQQQQHIYLQFEPAGWFYLYGTDYLDLCCKAPSGESPGGEKRSIIKHKFRRESCHIKVVADNSRPLQGKRSNNIKRYTDLVGRFSVTAYSQISY